MLKAIRMIEQLSGEKLVYIEDFYGNPVDNTTSKYPVKNLYYDQPKQNILKILQEQQKTIEEKDQEIKSLKDRLDKIESIMGIRE